MRRAAPTGSPFDINNIALSNCSLHSPVVHVEVCFVVEDDIVHCIAMGKRLLCEGYLLLCYRRCFTLHARQRHISYVLCSRNKQEAWNFNLNMRANSNRLCSWVCKYATLSIMLHNIWRLLLECSELPSFKLRLFASFWRGHAALLSTTWWLRALGAFFRSRFRPYGRRKNALAARWTPSGSTCVHVGATLLSHFYIDSALKCCYII